MIREKSPLVKYGITCSLAHVRICIVGCILQITQERLHYLLLASAKPVASILKWLKELITRWSQFMGIQWKLTVTFQKSQNIKKKPMWNILFTCTSKMSKQLLPHTNMLFHIGETGTPPPNPIRLLRSLKMPSPQLCDYAESELSPVCVQFQLDLLSLLEKEGKSGQMLNQELDFFLSYC